jgi:cell volume regulation protein A
MSEISEFGSIVLAISAVLIAAIAAMKLTQALPVPAPAIFLLAAAVASDAFAALEGLISPLAVERIGTVALVVILFDGGMGIGWRHLRRSAAPILSLGIVGTFATAALMAVFAHYVVGFDWTLAWLLGAAVAPTDPAVMFSVLGSREVGGRSGTILKGEAGANDPVGIALMIGLIEFATSDGGSVASVAREFTVEMAVGLGVGIAGGWLLIQLMRRVSLPASGLYPLRALAFAGLVYGAASVAGGSGFLAVFVAGLIAGDARAPYKAEVERFHDALASLGEITVFIVLGLTVSLADIWEQGLLWDGLALGALLALVVRPLAALPLLVPVRLRWGERLFIAWGGLKGAVPILLAAFAVVGDVEGARGVYGIVFVVVALSVLAQGSSMPLAARALGVPMRERREEPFDLSIRMRREPQGVGRYVVDPDSRVAGQAIRDLPIGEHSWISLVLRDGEPVVARGATVLEPEDELIVLCTPEDHSRLRRLFETPRPSRPEP